MITRSEYEHLFSTIERGQTVRVNHTDCEAGEDTRRRLYLTRPDAAPTKVLAYCHNCGTGNCFGDGGVEYRTHECDASHLELPSNEEFNEPANVEYDHTYWPSEAIEWKIRKNVSTETIRQGWIGYDTDHHSIYLPIWEAMELRPGAHTVRSKYLGYQLRGLNKHKPKYLTAKRSPELSLATTIFPPISPDLPMTCVIVEDYLSGLKVAQAGYRAYVNFGTSIDIKSLNLHLSGDLNNVVVWLDNDSEYIKDQAETMARTVALITGANTRTILHATDPKHYNRELIGDYVEEALEK